MNTKETKLLINKEKILIKNFKSESDRNCFQSFMQL